MSKDPIFSIQSISNLVLTLDVSINGGRTGIEPVFLGVSTLPDLFQPISLRAASSPDSVASSYSVSRSQPLTSSPEPILISVAADRHSEPIVLNSATLAQSTTGSTLASPVTSTQLEPLNPGQIGQQVESLNRVLPIVPSPTPPTLPTPPPPAPLAQVTFTTLTFTDRDAITGFGKEGTTGTFQVRLNQAPTTDVTLSFTPGNFLVVDGDNDLRNGTQASLTFTAQNWNQLRTVWFMAEVDGVSADRATGNTIAYTLTGGATSTGTYDLGVIKNTYAPDLSRFNIDLDFRNDTTGFWTAERRTIAARAATDWANRIGNEWTGLQLNTAFSKIGNDGNYTASTYATKRYVDDLVVFVNTVNTGGLAGGFGSPEYSIGGWYGSTELMPRVGQIAIDPAVGDHYLYNAVSHEIGHTLGLVGLNWAGYLQQDLTSPQTAVFKGPYATAANGGRYIPLQSQDGPSSVTGSYDYWHPSRTIPSIMSYGWLYSVSAPTAIDYAMLADSGYRVYGVNAAYPVAVTPPTATPTTPSTTVITELPIRPTLVVA